MTVVSLAGQKFVHQEGAFATAVSGREEFFGFLKCRNPADDFKKGSSQKDFITYDWIGSLVVRTKLGVDDIVNEPRVGHQNLRRKRTLEFG